jgi:hypothetical protein
MIQSGYCGLILRRVLAASHRDFYFALAFSRVTSRSPLHSSTSWPSTRRFALSMASASSAQTRVRIL